MPETECEFFCNDGWIELEIPARQEGGKIIDGYVCRERCPIHLPDKEVDEMDDDS